MDPVSSQQSAVSRSTDSRFEKREQRGFTLVELLVVIAIIAILSAFLMAAVRKGIQAAQKARAASHMRQIIIAYMDYVNGWGGDLGAITIAEDGTAHDWIAVLAQKGYFNDPRLVAFDFDPLVYKYDTAGFFFHFLGTLPQQIWDRSSGTFGDGFRNMPLSLLFVSGLNIKLATSHTPICCTRGLNESGSWNPVEGTTGDGSDGGVWGSTGGLIGLVGGNTEWRESLSLNPFQRWDGNGTTANIREAINIDAQIVDFRGTLTNFDESSSGNEEGVNDLQYQELRIKEKPPPPIKLE
jgi:prepilin-type N-terminal cleavage/methylation domain-containing protein